jgi:RNA polymerase sigma-54 factor
MALAQRMELKQGQVLAPRLLQAISLLQLSQAELDAYVQGALERNPLLLQQDAPTAKARGGVAARGPGGVVLAEALESSLTRTRTLHDHLEQQAGTAGFDPVDRLLASVLIDAVDEAGYLRADPAEIARRMGCAPGRVARLLECLQGFEPAGVFARDVRECLMLQLKDQGRYGPAMAAVLDRLDLVAKGDLAGLRRASGVDVVALQAMIAQLRGLKPRPGAAFGGEPAQAVIADAVVREAGDGLWRVELNSEALPRVLVDRRYHAVVSAGARTDSDKAFLADCLHQAHWVTRSLDQRARTVLKVAAEIVRRQDDFLVFGAERLRPMTLKAVADAIGMHESTVSRAAANKHLATPRGLFEMKYFFTAAVAAHEGEAHSAGAVRHRIRQMIQAEGRAVLSDEQIAVQLQRSGVDIARRTVAKYREALRIPAAAERRRRLRSAG